MKKPTIKNYYRTIKSTDHTGKKYDHTLFDYQKIWDDPAQIFLVISERGSKGKTTQAKKLARELYRNEGLKTMWVMNTLEQIKTEKRAHLTKPFQYLRDTFTGDEYVKGNLLFTGDKTNDNWYTTFVSLTTAENKKSSRENIGLLVFDEFNVGTTSITNSQTDLISSLIGTLTDPVNQSDSSFKKFIIHGNFKSLNSEFLLSLGITKIDGEITTINNSIDEPLVRILAPHFTKAEKEAIEKSQQGNWTFELQKTLGKSNHVYFNENLHDDINNIDVSLIHHPHKSKYLLKINYHYFILKNLLSSKWVIYKIDTDLLKDKSSAIVLDKRDVSEYSGFNNNFKESIRKLVFKGQLYFENSYVRENLLKKLRR